MRNGWSNCFLIVLYASPCVVLVGLIYLERLKMAEPSLVLSIRNIQVRKQISTPESAFASPIKKGKTGGTSTKSPATKTELQTKDVHRNNIAKATAVEVVAIIMSEFQNSREAARIRCCPSILRPIIVPMSLQRLLVTAVMVAAKFLEDEVLPNAAWSRPASASSALTSRALALRKSIYSARAREMPGPARPLPPRRALSRACAAHAFLRA